MSSSVEAARVPPRLGPRWLRRIPIFVAIIFFTVRAWQQRWVTDDGWINQRIVRQILAGRGPVFNAGERVEAGTSPLWLMLETPLAALLPHVSLGAIAVGLGLALSVLGFFAAAAAGEALTARAHEGASPLFYLPFGIGILALLPPMWDFATSGLETSLTWAWLATSFLGLVRMLDRPADALAWRPVWPAVVIGLAPLVRPDVTVIGALFGLALLAVSRPGLRSWLGGAGAALAIPVAYEVFRAGFFGELVPNTALAKDATADLTQHGIVYLKDYVHAHGFGITAPLVLLGLLALVARHRRDWRALVVTGAAVLGGLMHAAFVVHVGGDFMHARFLLPATEAVLLPVAVAPVSRRTWDVLQSFLCVLALVWSGAGAVHWIQHPPSSAIPESAIADERAYWTGFVPSHRTVNLTDWAGADNYDYGVTLAARHAAGDSVYIESGGSTLPDRMREYPAAQPGRLSASFPVLGAMANSAGLDVTIVDPLSLTDAVTARTRSTDGDPHRPGHQIRPAAWRIARYAAPSADDPNDVLDARAALACGDLAEVVHATQDPLTPGRFFTNLIEAPRLTMFSFSADPAAARQELCGQR